MKWLNQLRLTGATLTVIAGGVAHASTNETDIQPAKVPVWVDNVVDEGAKSRCDYPRPQTLSTGTSDCVIGTAADKNTGIFESFSVFEQRALRTRTGTYMKRDSRSGPLACAPSEEKQDRRIAALMDLQTDRAGREQGLVIEENAALEHC